MFAVQFLKKLMSTKGANMTEFGVMVALIALVSIGAVTLTGNQTRLTFETVETTLSDTVLGKKGPNENASDRAKENAAKNAPKVSNFIMPPDGVYEIGDILTFTMEFDKPITVNGTPAIQVTIGENVYDVPYNPALSDNKTLVFEYILTENDVGSTTVVVDPGGTDPDDTGDDGVTDPDTGTGVDTGVGDEDTSTDTTINGASCSTDCLYAALADGSVVNLNGSGQEVWRNTSHSGIVRKIAVDSSGNVYTAGEDNKVRKIDSSGNTVWTSVTFSSDMLDVAVAPNGDVFAGGWGGSVEKLRAADGVLIATYVTGSSTRDVTGVAVDASGIVYATRRANSGQGSPTAEILKLSNNLSTVLASTTTASGTLNDVNVDASGRIYAAGHTQCGLHGGCSGGGTYEDESGYIYNSTLTSLVRLYWPVSGRVNAIAVNPAGGAAVSQVNGSEAVHGFGLSNNDIQWTYTGHSDEVLDMAYDRNGNLFTASEDGTIHQLNATNGQFIQSFDLGSPVFGVAVAPGQPGAF